MNNKYNLIILCINYEDNNKMNNNYIKNGINSNNKRNSTDDSDINNNKSTNFYCYF